MNRLQKGKIGKLVFSPNRPSPPFPLPFPRPSFPHRPVPFSWPSPSRPLLSLSLTCGARPSGSPSPPWPSRTLLRVRCRAHRPASLGPHAKARSPPLFKVPAPPWNPWTPIDRKPPPLARANPSRHCCRARSSAPRRCFTAQPRRLRRSEGSPRGEDRPPPRNPSLSRVLGLGKAHRSLSSAGCRCAPCSGRLDPLPSTPSSL